MSRSNHHLAPEAESAPAARPRLESVLGRLSLRNKIISPFLALSVVVGVVAGYIVSLVIISNLEERFENQLLTTAGEAADALVGFEDLQLILWRQLAFTQGVAEAAAEGDSQTLRELVEPVFVNENAYRVDILSAEGEPLLTLSRTVADAAADYSDWAIFQQAIDNQASRHAGLRTVGEEIIFYTGGTLPEFEGQPAGVLLVGVSMDELAVWLQTQVLAAGVTFYSLEGQLLATTVGQSVPESLAIDRGTAAQTLAMQGTGGPLRTLDIAGDGFAQVLTPFEVMDGLDVGLLGISLPLTFVTSPLYPTRNVLVVIFTLTLLAIVFIGYLVAASIGRPIERLTAVSRQVALGDLSVQVDSSSRDEIGQLTRSFNTMVQQLRQRKYIEDLFGRYVGDNIAQRILAGEVELGGQRIIASVLFADIRGFSEISEKADLTELLDEMNEYYSLMTQAIEAHGGVINKFGGDSLLALFGAPLPMAGHAQAAYEAAIAMLDQLQQWNDRRVARGEKSLRVGIGVHTGEMVVGNLGSERRREYTALGDAVNTAYRLSELNRESPFTAVFISDATMSQVTNPNGRLIEELGEFTVRGKEHGVSLYAIMGSSQQTKAGG
ncbi:MAG: adenylate/guanylate cyclase domain-containing protein [Candidatus Promineifilaceae bacterium]